MKMTCIGCEYDEEDLKTDLDWFGSLGVNRKDAMSYIICLVSSKPDKSIKKRIDKMR